MCDNYSRISIAVVDRVGGVTRPVKINHVIHFKPFITSAEPICVLNYILHKNTQLSIPSKRKHTDTKNESSQATRLQRKKRQAPTSRHLDVNLSNIDRKNPRYPSYCQNSRFPHKVLVLVEIKWRGLVNRPLPTS